MDKKAIYIEWVDSCSTHTWMYPEDYDGKPISIRSLGLLMKETKTAITISSGVSETGKYAEPFTIPKAVIKRRVSIKFPKKRQKTKR